MKVTLAGRMAGLAILHAQMIKEAQAHALPAKAPPVNEPPANAFDERPETVQLRAKKGKFRNKNPDFHPRKFQNLGRRK